MLADEVHEPLAARAVADLLAYTSRLIAIRKEHPAFHRRKWFEGVSIRGTQLTDIGWFRPDGSEMGDEDWQVGYAQALGVFLHGDGLHTLDARGRPVLDDSFYLIFNGSPDAVSFRVPPVPVPASPRVRLARGFGL